MIRKLTLLAVGLVVFTGYILYLNFFNIATLQAGLEPQNANGYYDYRGLTNVHSELSTGSEKPEAIVDIANETHLDFLFFMEVNQPTRRMDLEGYHSRTMVIVGGEYSYLDSKLLYYNPPLNQPPEGASQAQMLFNDLLSQGDRSLDQGFLVLAHPLLAGQKWEGEYPVGISGIEVINLRRVLESGWATNKLKMILSFILYPLNPNLGLLMAYSNPNEEIALWDYLNQKPHHVYGYMGSDATAKAILFENTNIKIPSYETIFRLASNHVMLRSELTGQYASDRVKVLRALKQGQFYIALDVLANPKGFLAEMRGKKERYPMGSTIRLNPSHHSQLQLVIEMPGRPQAPFEVVIYKDGAVYFTSNSLTTTVAIDQPGVYRTVVRLIPTFPVPFGKRWMPWIYTNPFFVTGSKN